MSKEKWASLGSFFKNICKGAILTKARIVNIISNSNYESRRVNAQLVRKLKDLQLTPSREFSDQAELTIVIGGDGAFIKAVKQTRFSPIPIVGINTGHLGFYQEIIPDQLDDFLEAYMNGRYVLEQVSLLGAEIFTKNRNFFVTALNEIVIKAQHSKVLHLNLFLNRNHVEKFSGDGMLIATPSGSTGYNFSAGGSLIYPTLEVLEITPLNPITSSAYRSLSNSIIVPGDVIATLVPERRYSNSSLLVIDGIEYSYRQLRKVNVKMSDRKINRITLNKDNYWNNLKSKFLD